LVGGSPYSTRTQTELAVDASWGATTAAGAGAADEHAEVARESDHKPSGDEPRAEERRVIGPA